MATLLRTSSTRHDLENLSRSNFADKSYSSARRMNLTDHIQRAVMKDYPPIRLFDGSMARYTERCCCG